MSTAKKKLTTCQPKTAVAYARYSSAQQRDVSIEQQLRDIRMYAEQEGYTIVHEYADHAKSGYHNSERRTEFQAMLRAAGSGAFDTVIAWKVDRFGRNRRESAMYKGQLADQGVKVVYAMEPIPDGAAGVLTEGMLEAIAEWYSRNLSENTKRGKHDNATKCLSNGNPIFGYRTGPDGHYIIDEAQAAIVRRVFTLYSQGYSCHSIYQMFKEEGIRNRRGQCLANSTIIYMVQNDRYTGIYKYMDIRTPGGMPAIIDKELFDVCQNLRAKTIRHFEKHPGEYLLSGKCFCGYCGSPMHGYSGYSKGRKYFYYMCRKRKNEKTCKAKIIRKPDLEGKILDLIFNDILSGDRLDWFINQISAALQADGEMSPVSKMESDLKTIRRKINNINAAIAEGIWSPETGEHLKALSAQAEELQNSIAFQKITGERTVSKSRIKFYLHKVAKGTREDETCVKTVINSLINSITVYEKWIRVVINAVPNMEQIPPEELPTLDTLHVFKGFDCDQTAPVNWSVVEPYPLIVFKLAI